MYMAKQPKTISLDFQEEKSMESQPLTLETIEKQYTQFLIPQNTNDANIGTFVASNNTAAIQLADGSTKTAYFTLITPTDFRLVSVKLVWSTPATSKVALFKVDIGEGGELEANNERTTGGTNFTVTSAATASDLNFTEIINKGAVYLSRVKQKTLWGIKLSRIGGDASDTLSDVANVYGLLIKYK